MILCIFDSLPEEIIFHFPYLFFIKNGLSWIDVAFLPVPHCIAVFVILNGPPRIYLTLLQITLHFPVCAFYHLPAGNNIALLCVKGIGRAGSLAPRKRQKK